MSCPNLDINRKRNHDSSLATPASNLGGMLGIPARDGYPSRGFIFENAGYAHPSFHPAISVRLGTQVKIGYRFGVIVPVAG